MDLKQFEDEFMSEYRVLFFLAEKQNMLRLQKQGKRWTLEYRDIKNYAPRSESDFCWKVVCSQSIEKDYEKWIANYKPYELAQRFIQMLANSLQQRSQDVNGILDENILTRKPIV